MLYIIHSIEEFNEAWAQADEDDRMEFHFKVGLSPIRVRLKHDMEGGVYVQNRKNKPLLPAEIWARINAGELS